MSDISTKELFEKSLDLAKPIVDLGCDLMRDLLGKPCRVAGELMADQVYSWQWGNRIRILAKAKAIMEQNQTTAKVLPPGFFLPYLDASGNIEDDEVEKLWAGLLANASADVEASKHPMTLHVLRQLSSKEAQALTTIGSRPPTWHIGNRKPLNLVDENDETLARLVCLGLFVVEDSGKSYWRGKRHVYIELTPFGRQFLNAVGLKRKPEDENLSNEEE